MRMEGLFKFMVAAVVCTFSTCIIIRRRRITMITITTITMTITMTITITVIVVSLPTVSPPGGTGQAPQGPACLELIQVIRGAKWGVGAPPNARFSTFLECPLLNNQFEPEGEASHHLWQTWSV